MAPTVLFVHPVGAPAGYFRSFDDATTTLQLVALKADATTFPDQVAAGDQRATLMGALKPDGLHVVLGVDIQDD
jgi:hypothetical protein